MTKQIVDFLYYTAKIWLIFNIYVKSVNISTIILSILLWIIAFYTDIVGLYVVATILTIIFTISILLGFVYYLKYCTYLEHGYKLNEVELVFRYLDRTKISQECESKYSIEFTRTGVSKFRDRSFWTGQGTILKPEVLSQGHRIESHGERINIWSITTINLGTMHMRGDTANVHLREKFKDEELKMNQYIAKTIYEPTRKLILIADLSKVNFSQGRAVVYSSFEGEKVIENKDLIFQKNSRILKWEIINPRLYQRYEVRWS